MSRFSHLHVHTQYSLLDGAADIGALFKKAADDHMPALAITDHGNMFGVFEFVAQAQKHKNPDGSLKVKPIVGCEFYVSENRLRKTFSKEEKDRRYHQVLLAKNETGYNNLVKLTSLGFIEGMYGKYPRIDKELIHKYHEGLIATTCCLGAWVPQTILSKGEEEGENEFKWWLNIFQDDYYVELQRHGMQEQDRVNALLIKWARKYDVKIIASNDSHYVEQTDFNAHDILLCINTGEKLSTPALREFNDDDLNVKNKRFAFPNDQFYFKRTDEMKQLFQDLPEAIDNTNEIADKVSVLSLKKDILLPAFPLPKEFIIHEDNNLNQWEYLKHLTYEGARTRYSEITEEIRERLDFELFTIKTMGFAGYFLIVSDFIKAGREIGVFVGPGRGSAAGSAVAFCIGITNIDPIKYKLLFERFLNPDRKSMPDIDTDFDDAGRQKVIEYVVGKYGRNQVAQIITYGTMAAKMSIKDVARVMDLPLPESNALAKLVPEKPGISLKRVLHAPLKGEKSLEEDENLQADDLDKVKKIRELYKSDTLASKVLHEAEILEGSVRNTGIHAAGIIIAPKDLTELLPVCKSKDSELWVTQIEGNIIEDAGVIKMDFLGLKTLTIIKNALQLIKENHQIEIDIDQIPLDDVKTLELYQRGDTIATFQFESPGMQKYLKELKPDQFADLIAMNALYRPGPMSYIPNFIDRKHGKEAITYDLAEMEEILKETYGITVYQEQVMLLAQKLAGFSKGDADVLRKAMGKKDRATLDKRKSQFMEGAKAKGYPEEKLLKIWGDWESFAEYAFNKSHSTCYAFVAYQTAYLKAHYPGEFMSAVLNNAGSIEKITFFMDECIRMGLKVLGPDINESQSGFAVNKESVIRLGLGGLKGVGENAVESIIEERKKNGAFRDIFDFIKRINQRAVNKRSLENLVYAGAFDSFKEMHRAQYFHVPPGEMTTGLERIINFGNRFQASKTQQSNTLFGEAMMMDVPTPKIPNCKEWTLTEKLNHEKEITGMFISGHPLDHFRFELQFYRITSLSDFSDFKDAIHLQPKPQMSFRLAGLITDAQHRISKNGKQFGVFSVEDYSGKTELALFGEDYVKFKEHLSSGSVVYIVGSFKNRWNNEKEFDFKVERVYLLETIKKILTKKIIIRIEPRFVSDTLIHFMEKNIKINPGKSSLQFELQEPGEGWITSFQTSDKGFEMNDEMAHFLMSSPELDVAVQTI
jgi:DNA polymerase-3 subunit alpha